MSQLHKGGAVAKCYVLQGTSTVTADHPLHSQSHSVGEQHGDALSHLQSLQFTPS